MNIQLGLMTLGLLAVQALSQPLHRPPNPSNCTQTFDYSNSLEELLDQFRDDDIRHNLTKASEVFWSHPVLSTNYIYDTLRHEDWQVRQIICREIWHRIDKDQPGYTITKYLVAVTIEGLRHDTTPYDFSRRRGLVYNNAVFGVSRLIPVAHDWVKQLEEAMESDDPQQQLLAAYILGRGGVAQSAQRASQILLPHLRDNNIGGDARFCTYGLGGFGPELLPYLKDAMPAADTQQQDLIALLIVDIMDPPFTEQNRKARSRYNTITTTVYDPAAELGLLSYRWLDQLNH